MLLVGMLTPGRGVNEPTLVPFFPSALVLSNPITKLIL